ncbi:MAG: hypothetical protein IPK22_19780 [Verrucomicrobiaceae bacterium]|nr:hypothetical protein [Verrucomicrobiaceae bacterium]
MAEKLPHSPGTFQVADVNIEEVILPDGRFGPRVAVEESTSLNRFLRLRVLRL